METQHDGDDDDDEDDNDHHRLVNFSKLVVFPPWLFVN
jgi:hypothetical protein